MWTSINAGLFVFRLLLSRCLALLAGRLQPIFYICQIKADSMEDIKVRIGRLIREARKGQELTQKELGEKMGLTESTITKYEKGKQNLSLDTIQAIVDALGVELEVNFKK